MPCVLPVIALKILGFVSQSKEEPRRVRQLGMVYGMGVLASFLVLAGLAIGAQRAGGVANWGDAFRNPQFQIILTILMALIALNLFGVFEITIGGKALATASELSGRAGFPGHFLMAYWPRCLPHRAQRRFSKSLWRSHLRRRRSSSSPYFWRRDLGWRFPLSYCVGIPACSNCFRNRAYGWRNLKSPWVFPYWPRRSG